MLMSQLAQPHLWFTLSWHVDANEVTLKAHHMRMGKAAMAMGQAFWQLEKQPRKKHIQSCGGKGGSFVKLPFAKAGGLPRQPTNSVSSLSPLSLP